jgi:hypothetical protein
MIWGVNDYEDFIGIIIATVAAGGADNAFHLPPLLLTNYCSSY